MTVAPVASRRRATWKPMNPAAPVTRTVSAAASGVAPMGHSREVARRGLGGGAPRRANLDVVEQSGVTGDVGAGQDGGGRRAPVVAATHPARPRALAAAEGSGGQAG